MIPRVLPQRHHQSKMTKAFNDLIRYIEDAQIKSEKILLSNRFSAILNYSVAEIDDMTSKEKCVAIRTHGVLDISTAHIEMNAVAAKNIRCKDPTYHFILSWPEHERPKYDAIFDAAEHAIAALGLKEHQYVIAIHGNTDNVHCHIAINRINPITFRSRNIEWATKTLHLAARQSEIKHNWSHDNGIYVVKTDAENRKTIVINSELASPESNHFRQTHSTVLPAWHDPESLESWIKRDIAKALKEHLPNLQGWSDLHYWLHQYGIKVVDTGGGGMRIQATSQITMDVISLPMSKSLRMLKLVNLEKQWGKFSQSPLTEVDANSSENHSPKLPRNINFTNSTQVILEIPHRREMNHNFTPDLIDNQIPIENIRNKRIAERALARADLRKRFAQHRKLADSTKIDFNSSFNLIKIEKRIERNALEQITKQLIHEARKSFQRMSPELFREIAVIDFEKSRVKHDIEQNYLRKKDQLDKKRIRPLSWRPWLLEQTKLGDQSALSALRGIVYQEQRDKKRNPRQTSDFENLEKVDLQGSDYTYRRLMNGLLEEERHEIAIRSTHFGMSRPFEVDALLSNYIKLKWNVTGNGNIVYESTEGRHVFTDRGNRLTFDRAVVSDDEIRLALTHAKQKFGNNLLLTGSDPDFKVRMAKLADDMGLIAINPECQEIILQHRKIRDDEKNAVESQANDKISNTDETDIPETQSPDKYRHEPIPFFEPMVSEISDQRSNPVSTIEQLQVLVRAINPDAQFIIPEQDSKQIFIGPVIANFLQFEKSPSGFAQHIGRGKYALHIGRVPVGYHNEKIRVQYKHGEINIQVTKNLKNVGREIS